MTEQWRPIPGYEGYYEASDFGRIRSLSRVTRHTHSPKGRRIRGRVLVQSNHNAGYLNVLLCAEGVRKTFLVHRLVAATFLPNPEGLREVDHADFDRKNNRVSNLSWCDTKENHARSWRAGRRGATTPKITAEQANEIRQLLAAGTKQHEVAAQYGISRPNVSTIKNGKTWVHRVY